MALLSACLIVRDEERSIGRCLDSLAAIADDIVVGDTGSRDRTRSLVLERGVRLIDVPWQDDFSRARNSILPHAAGRWILSIDADEWVVCENTAAIKKCLGSGTSPAWRVWHVPQSGWTPYLTLRVFPNHPSIRFEGIIHETVLPSIRRTGEFETPICETLPLTIRHDGYDGDQGDKHMRNRPLLEKELIRKPDNVNNLRHYALILRERGESARAETLLEKALDIVRTSPHRIPTDSLPFIDAIQYALGQREEALRLAEEAASLFPDNANFLWYRGLIEMREGSYQKAIHTLETLLMRGKTGEYDRTVSYPEVLFFDYPLQALGEGAFDHGDFARAERCFAALNHRYPDNTEFRVKRDLCAAKKRQER